MTFNAIKYENLPGFSRLFVDFINGNKFFENRFPNNNRLFEDTTYLSSIGLSCQHRNLIKSTIKDTMNDLFLNQKQSENLHLLSSQNNLAVVTGQQVGFLGGPLYTIVKALSAVSLATKLNSFHKDFSFVPIFWIEDNDHDNLESSQIIVYDKNYTPKIFNCDEFPDKSDRRVVSGRKFDEFITKVINDISEIFFSLGNNSEITTRLKDIYKPSKSWRDAFVELMNYLIGFTGILFISASQLQKTGVFHELAKKELENIGKIENLIQYANSQLEKNGYHIQAKTAKINLFFQKAHSRHKIEPISGSQENFRISDEIYNQKDLIKEVSQYPSNFSPNVLLRPIFQDYTLPTVAYVAGPSEIGYCSQLKEVYEYFRITMPAFIPRHSVTFIDRRTTRFLEKTELSPAFFFKKRESLQSFILEKFKDKESEIIISQAAENVHEIFDKLKALAKSIEPTLEANVDSFENKTKQMIDTIGKKIRSAELRKYDFLITKYLEASNYLYPFETYQERIYPFLNFLINTEKDTLIPNFLKFFKYEPNSHYLIYI